MIIYHKKFTYPKCKWIVECKTGQKVKEKYTEDDRLVRNVKSIEESRLHFADACSRH